MGGERTPGPPACCSKSCLKRPGCCLPEEGFRASGTIMEEGVKNDTATGPWHLDRWALGTMGCSGSLLLCLLLKESNGDDLLAICSKWRPLDLGPSYRVFKFQPPITYTRILAVREARMHAESTFELGVFSRFRFWIRKLDPDQFLPH